MTNRLWSTQQQAVFNWFRTGTGNLIVRARAGTGKTTTMVEALKYAPEKNPVFCAFGKKIATELQSRVSNADVSTFHSLGFAAVRRYWERTRMDERGARKDALAREVCGPLSPDPITRLVAKLHTAGREMAPLTTDWRDLLPIAYDQDCVPDEDWVDRGFDLDWICQRACMAMDLAATVRPLATGIDFTDMIYLPVRNKWLQPKYDLVIVDEAQDLNATQLLIARGIASGRTVVVGDDRQAIFGFRGADSGALDRLKRELNATELSLNVTYRCGRKIVESAARLVPDFEAAPSNPDGEIQQMSVTKVPEVVAIGDFVLSRKNAPLATMALRILRTGKRAKIEGRDIGAGLKALVGKFAKGRGGSSMPEFLERVTNWQDKEVTRAARSKDKLAEGRIERINDQADTLRALAEGLSGVPELQTRIEQLFADDGGPRVICSSIHRAKGLEADRVFVLDATLIHESPCGCGHHRSLHGSACSRCDCTEFCEDAKRQLEERNLEYVAITRAKTTLVRVAGLP